MRLNYQAFTRPNGDNLNFPAKDDAEARALLEDYLKETKQHEAMIYHWSSEKAAYNYEDKHLVVKIPEVPTPQHVEYKVETRYIKWLRFEETMTEREFEKKAKETAAAFDQLPEYPGWEKNFRSDRVGIADDERYGAEVEKITLK